MPCVFIHNEYFVIKQSRHTDIPEHWASQTREKRTHPLALSGTRTHDHSLQAVEKCISKPQGYCDRLICFWVLELE
jgi:hypothetical protein